MRAGWIRPSSTSFASVMPRGLATHRVEAAEHHGLGGVVDDQVHAGGRLEGPDVAALATDDAALHVLAREREHADGRLGGLLGGHALDRDRDDLARPLLALLARPLLDLADLAMAARFASSVICAIRWSRASVEVMPAIFSSWARCSSVACSSWERT